MPIIVMNKIKRLPNVMSVFYVRFFYPDIRISSVSD